MRGPRHGRNRLLGRAIVRALNARGAYEPSSSRAPPAVANFRGGWSMETFATAPRSTAPPMASMRSVTPRRSSASGDDAARTSTTSTSADWRTRSKCAARAASLVSIYTSSFLALPPAGHERPIEANDYQRTKVAGLRVARAAVGIGTPLVTLAARRHLRAGRVNRRQPRRAPRSAIICAAAAGDHRRRSSVVICVCGRRGGGARRGADARSCRARICDSAARTRRRCACSRFFARLRGTPLPRRIPYGVATALGGLEEGWQARPAGCRF